MSVAADARPIELPLPGGQEGATVRLHPLRCGEIMVPPDLIESRGGRFSSLRAMRRDRDEWVWLPVPAFLVEHPTAGAIMVDTGLHPSVAVDPVQNLGRLAARMYGWRLSADQAADEHLRDRGIQAANVRVVVMTHLHWDHASGVSEFPLATFVVDHREWEAATTRGRLRRGYRKAHVDFGFDWRTIDYEAREVDSFATFGPTVDLFGDGSIRLVSTPGHSAGHQSVLLRLSDREALLTGDAAYELRTIRDEVRPLLMHDEHRYLRSLKEIRRYLEQAPEALVIAGHDRAEWPRLQAVYE